MKIFSIIHALKVVVYFYCFCVLASCTGSNGKTGIPLTRDYIIAHAPVLSPEEFIRFTNIEKGFELQVVAAEPEIIAPVSMIFDRQNRIWAVEMTSYMPDIEGNGENDPNGKVVILEDADKDGYYEKRTVFLDSLILPRAIAFVEKGLLVAEPPNLWYYEIVDDKPQHKTLVDAQYTEGNNVEAQSNGLYRATDNWIYNAGSAKRYMKADTGWVISKTHFRGQWGITQSDDGRLFYNNNSQNLLGDFFLPGLGSNNPNLPGMEGFNQRIVTDNSIFPCRPTTGVNRGYSDTEMGDSLRLKKFTAACGPVLYRADLFGKDYYQNAFVAEPAGNLIKRDALFFSADRVEGKPLYSGSEFIASNDERFRPVSLYTGPDGALYIVDMYRGIIQNKLMITKYLQDEIKKRNLEKPLNCGRIYRVVPQGTTVKQFIMPTAPLELIKLFKSKNGWIRDKAQQMLVDCKPDEVIAPLKRIVDTSKNIIEFIHSLWTLKGLNAISDKELMDKIIPEKDPRKLIQLYTALEKINDTSYNRKEFILKTKTLINDSVLAPCIAFKSYAFAGYSNSVMEDIQHLLLTTYPYSKTIAQAIISGSSGYEVVLDRHLKKGSKLPENAVVFAELQHVFTYIQETQNPGREKLLEKKYGRGIWLFKTTCQTCHGSDGEGIENLAPPLNNSNWVTGDKHKLISIALYGLTGPVTVNKKKYEVPKVSGEMPAFINNPGMVESDMALLLSYIRNNWNNKADDVKPEDIKQVKEKWGNRTKPFTAEELSGGK
ncbi:MAG: c-type cytochrome [Bacteroidetes bacterium]|nr:c-type cytochrome [Bacteroidota bacterium]